MMLSSLISHPAAPDFIIQTTTRNGTQNVWLTALHHMCGCSGLGPQAKQVFHCLWLLEQTPASSKPNESSGFRKAERLVFSHNPTKSKFCKCFQSKTKSVMKGEEERLKPIFQTHMLPYKLHKIFVSCNVATSKHKLRLELHIIFFFQWFSSCHFSLNSLFFIA